jgi:hypothetical protein
MDMSMNKWCPSLLACSAIFLGKKILQIKKPWSNFMYQQTGYYEIDVK